MSPGGKGLQSSSVVGVDNFVVDVDNFKVVGTDWPVLVSHVRVDAPSLSV